MPKEPKYKLIEEETLRELLSTQFQLSYSIILLSYICQRNKLDTTLTANEAGGIIKLSPRQINDARNRCLIRAVNCGTCKLYSIFDLAMLAANLHRKRPGNPNNSPLLFLFKLTFRRDRPLVKAVCPAFLYSYPNLKIMLKKPHKYVSTIRRPTICHRRLYSRDIY